MKTGIGAVCQAGLQSAWGTPVAPTAKINMTSESVECTVEKGDEGNLLPKKTKDQADIIAVNVDGSVSAILRPEFADWLFHAALGKKAANDNVYTLADPNTDLPVSTMVISRGGIVKTYPDVTITRLTLTCPAQDYVRVSFDISGVRELSAGETGAQTIQNLSFTLPSYKCTGATLKYDDGGTSAASLTKALCVEETDISIENSTEEAPATYCDGLYNGRPVLGLRAVTVDVDLPYGDDVEAFRQDYLLNTDAPTVAIELKFTTADPDEYITVYMPNVSINAASGNVDGQGIIGSSISGEALSIGTAEPITVTVNHAA